MTRAELRCSLACMATPPERPSRWTRAPTDPPSWRGCVEAHGVVHIPRFWSEQRCGAAVAAIEAARAHWIADFDGVQHALGRAWYTHLETDRTALYFAESAKSDAQVESVLPGLQASLREALSSATGRPVRQRRGWCGAGVHIFEPGGRCARVGGSVHFDYEGLTRAQLRDHTPAWSMVLSLQPAASGGGLRLYDVVYSDHEVPTAAERAAPYVDLDYTAGDLVIFDSHRLHWIQPFGGDRARISATLHGVQTSEGWECWF